MGLKNLVVEIALLSSVGKPVTEVEIVFELLDALQGTSKNLDYPTYDMEEFTIRVR